MTNPYRAMCAELSELDGHCVVDCTEEWADAMCRLRAALAQPEPAPEGPGDEELDELYFYIDARYVASWRHYARAALAKWGTLTPQPVAVSERLPGPEDCLDEGWAWFFNKRIGWRQAVLPVSPGYTHWLPANALPTPEATND